MGTGTERWNIAAYAKYEDGRTAAIFLNDEMSIERVRQAAAEASKGLYKDGKGLRVIFAGKDLSAPPYNLYKDCTVHVTARKRGSSGRGGDEAEGGEETGEDGEGKGTGWHGGRGEGREGEDLVGDGKGVNGRDGG